MITQSCSPTPFSAAPLSVVTPTLNSEDRLPVCLDAFVGAATGGLVREVIVSDGGSTDRTKEIAEGFGARFIDGPAGRGGQLARGAAAARGRWFLFVHSDTALAAGWAEAVEKFIARDEGRAGVFRLAFDARHARARAVAFGARVRFSLLASPYGDQGLLISRRLYEAVGGYRDMPLFEDVDIVDRIIKARGRAGLSLLPCEAITSAARYEANGYLRRVLKNAACLAMYRLGRSPSKILSFYRAK